MLISLNLLTDNVLTASGQSWRLTNVARRDDAFNKLVAISPSAWSQT